jgi:uncharacterized protein (DUF1015 family)
MATVKTFAEGTIAETTIKMDKTMTIKEAMNDIKNCFAGMEVFFNVYGAKKNEKLNEIIMIAHPKYGIIGDVEVNDKSFYIINANPNVTVDEYIVNYNINFPNKVNVSLHVVEN